MTAPVSPPLSAPPDAPPAMPGIRSTVAAAFRLVWRNPRATMLPFAIIQVPLTLAVAALTVGLYLTAFKNQPVEAMQDAFTAGAGGPLFLFLATTAAQALFAQVARGAAIISIAGIINNRPTTLTGALDPAFTRMGALLALAIIVGAGFALALVSVVGLVVLPYLAVRVAIAFEAMMVEGISPWAAIRRSWLLTRGNALRLFAIILLSALVIVGPLLLITGLGAMIGGGRTVHVLESGLYIFAQGVFVVPLVAFLTATTTLYYLTIRAIHDERRTA